MSSRRDTHAARGPLTDVIARRRRPAAVASRAESMPTLREEARARMGGGQGRHRRRKKDEELGRVPPHRSRPPRVLRQRGASRRRPFTYCAEAGFRYVQFSPGRWTLGWEEGPHAAQCLRPCCAVPAAAQEDETTSPSRRATVLAKASNPAQPCLRRNAEPRPRSRTQPDEAAAPRHRQRPESGASRFSVWRVPSRHHCFRESD